MKKKYTNTRQENNFVTRNKRGVTLVEFLVAIAIFTLILGALSLFQRDVLNFNKVSDSSLQVVADSRIIVRTLIKDLRSALPGSDGSYPLVQVATSTITFYSDTNDDGLKEKIRYYLSDTLFKKGSITPTGTPPTYNSGNEVISTLVYNVRNTPSNPVFEYYDSTYDGTNLPLSQPVQVTQVRLVKINLLLDVDPNKAPSARLYSSQVMLRNLKDNL